MWRSTQHRWRIGGGASTKRARLFQSSASARVYLIYSCPGPPPLCSPLGVRQEIYGTPHGAGPPLPVSSAPVQPERSGRFLKQYRRLPEASCGLNSSAGDCRGDSLLLLGGVCFAGKTEWRSCATTAAVASVSTPRPMRMVRRSVTRSLPPVSLSRPLASFTSIHLASPHAAPGSLPGLSPSPGAQGRALQCPRCPSFLSEHPLHFLNSRAIWTRFTL